MGKDFYLDDHALAAYFEKDWFDFVLGTPGARPNRFAFAPFDLRLLHSPFHERFAELILTAVGPDPARPIARLLEIGSGTGRTFFELARRIPTLGHATLVEPSDNLRGLCARIFDAEAADAPYLPVLRGNGELTEVRLPTAEIRRASAHVRVRRLGVPFAALYPEPEPYDLVVCANVVDQCHDPLDLVDLLRRSTAVGGLVALACTYQWQAKYRGLPARPIRHLDELFVPPRWIPAGEADVPFAVRVNERHWMTFLSHVCVFRRTES